MFLNFKEKKTLISSYFYSNFNYCPLVWMFSSAKSLNKVESLQKRALRFLYEDYVSSCDELLQKAGKEIMKVNRLRSLCIEIYKLINYINPTYMNEIFTLRKISRVCSNYKLNLDAPTINQVRFGGGVCVCVCVFMLFHLLVSSGCTTSVIYVRSSDQRSFVVSIFWALLPTSFISISGSILFHLQRRKLQPFSYWRENDMI